MEDNEKPINPDLSLDDIFLRLDSDETADKSGRQPFKFLDSYTKEDSDIFFGREEETEDMFRKFYHSKILLIYGHSGTGKSSVVSCGLLNKIPQEDIYPIKIRCGKEAYNQFVQDIRKHTDLVSNEPFEILQNIYGKNSKPILLLFDQFEEIFILSTPEKRKQLIDTVKKLVEGRLKINFIFVIREEYLANLTEFETVISTIFQNRIRIERLHRIKAAQVIENPCKVCGINIESGVSDLIIDKLTDDKGTLELTYLQVIMDRLYKKATVGNPAKVSILKKHFDELQSIGNVLTQYLDEQLQTMPNSKGGERVLKTMVSADGTKRRMNIEEIEQNLKMTGSSLSTNELQDILQYFVNARIISDKDEHNNYELRHDSLAAKIYEKITLVEREIIEVRQFIEHACSSYQKRGVYLSAADLQYIGPYENKLIVSGKENEFIAKSKNQLQKARRIRRNIIVGILLGIFAIMGIFTIWALQERTKAVENEKHVKIVLEQVKTEKDKAESALRKFQEEERQRKQAEVNSLLQKARSFISFGEFEMASKVLTQALKIDSTNKDINTEFNNIPANFRNR